MLREQSQWTQKLKKIRTFSDNIFLYVKRDKKITDERLPDDGDVPELVCDGDGGVIERHGRRHPPGRRVVGEYHQLVLAPEEISPRKYFSKLWRKHRRLIAFYQVFKRKRAIQTVL